MSAVTNDSGKWNLTKNDHLPGGVVSVVRGKASSLIEVEENIKGKHDNWIEIKLNNNGKTSMMTSVCRIPATSSGKICCCLTQHDLIEGKAKSPSEHRNETLKEIEECMQQNDDVNDVTIDEDLSQNASSKQRQQFFNNIGAMDAHQWCNQANRNNMDHTEVRGSKRIDAIAVSCGMLEHIDGFRSLECNEKTLTDHRSCSIDLNLEDNFQD